MRRSNKDMPFFDYIVEDSECDTCEFFDPDEERCRAFECNGLECPSLPCEQEEFNDNRNNDTIEEAHGRDRNAAETIGG